MSSSNNRDRDYVVEKIVAKGVSKNGRPLYLIKWKGYSTAENTWEPPSHVLNCQALVKEFEAEQEKEETPVSPATRTSKKFKCASLSPLVNTNDRSKRSASNRSRHSTSGRLRKRSSNNNNNNNNDTNDNSLLTDDDDEDFKPSKPIQSNSPRRSRKSTNDVEMAPATINRILDTAKLDKIHDVRRNKRTNTIEYQVQLAKVKKNCWIPSNQLSGDYAQQIVEFMEGKYVE